LAGGVNRVTVEHEASANDSSRDGSTGNASAAGFDYEIFWFELFEMLNARLMPGKVSIATAPGKVNLFFKVGPLLESGYHDVASLYLAVDLRETVTAQIATEYSVQVTGSLGDFQLLSVPTDETNLVVKVAEQVKAAAGTPSAIKLVLGIDKHVPVAGGMGGGSRSMICSGLTSTPKPCTIWPLNLAAMCHSRLPAVQPSVLVVVSN
jgi:hypothetical protein